MNCKTINSKIQNYLDGELSAKQKEKFEAHVQECASCTAQVKTFRLIFKEAAGLEKQAAPDDLWQKIAFGLDAKPQPAWETFVGKLSGWRDNFSLNFILSSPAIKFAGMALLMALGIWIGRLTLPSVQNNDVQVAQQPEASGYRLAAQEYIEKSKILFLGVINADAEDIQNSGLKMERQMAQNLVREAAVLKDSLSDNRDARLKRLVTELEMILVEIANMEESRDIKDVELIKSGIDRKGLMLKINLQDFSAEKNTKKDKAL
jgi:hypothetical protein